jgi:hypothetical protein
MRRTAAASWVLVTLLAASGCAANAATVPPAARASAPTSGVAATQSSATPSPAHPLAPPAVNGLSWRAAGTVVAGRPATYLAMTRSGSIALLWMDPSALSFRFIPGTQFPEGGPLLPADRQSATWVPRLAAAFNGAFKLRDHVGGYYYAGRIVSPLRPGLASLVVDDAGRLSVIQWGRERTSVAGVQVVRQNMGLLVDQYAAEATAHDSNSRWGWADHDTRLANRSALGELADGSLVYAFGHDVTALDLADALVQARARTAIMLDMNLAQPMGYVYWHQAGRVVGKRVLPSVYHSPSIYLAAGYYKDFVVALVRP